MEDPEYKQFNSLLDKIVDKDNNPNWKELEKSIDRKKFLAFR